MSVTFRHAFACNVFLCHHRSNTNFISMLCIAFNLLIAITAKVNSLLPDFSHSSVHLPNFNTWKELSHLTVITELAVATALYPGHFGDFFSTLWHSGLCVLQRCRFWMCSLNGFPFVFTDPIGISFVSWVKMHTSCGNAWSSHATAAELGLGPIMIKNIWSWVTLIYEISHVSLPSYKACSFPCWKFKMIPLTLKSMLDFLGH